MSDRTMKAAQDGRGRNEEQHGDQAEQDATEKERGPQAAWKRIDEAHNNTAPGGPDRGFIGDISGLSR